MNGKSLEWKKEQNDIFRTIERHQGANRSYLDEGVKLKEKRRIINFVCSNSNWKDGRLRPNYRQPFDMLAETNLAHQKKRPFSEEKRPF